MQVTFQPKSGTRERWEILLDGEKWREVHQSIFGRHPTFPSIPPEENLQSIFDALEYRRTKGYVLWRLSMQSYHSEILAKMLRDRLVQTKTIDRVMDEMRENGFLNDEAWIESFFRVQQKRNSLPLILSKLRLKGLSAKTIQQLANERKNPELEIEAIQHLINTRYRRYDLSEFKIRQKIITALMRKGYSFDQVQTALQTS